MKSLTVVKGQHAAHRLKLLRPVLALAFIAGALVCSNAWAQRGPHGGAHGGGHGVHGGLGGHYGGHGHYGGQRGHRWHGHGGAAIVIGGPLFWPGYGSGWYDDPYYGYRPVRPIMVQPAPPVVYIERGVPSSQPLWYFCDSAQGYYPYVKQCTSPWRAVAPGSVTR